MRCLSPRTVGFLADGKTITWSQKHYSKEFATFQLPCSKCIECRLEYSKQWAVRCVHEAHMHEENSFVTLTYKELHDPKLNYKHFQDFMKRLRFHYPNQQIGVFVTGEYGDLLKRPHWHAILFNWQPKDIKYKYSNDRGDKIYESQILDKLWTHGITELGSVTFESAAYCARYAAKKLVHGKDGEHDFNPISKRSSKHAIGKKFLEKYWQDIFNYGQVKLLNGKYTSIPRYYEKWLQKNQPDAWIKYITETKRKKTEHAQAISQQIQQTEKEALSQRANRGNFQPYQSRAQARTQIINEKFKQLQKHLKGDI